MSDSYNKSLRVVIILITSYFAGKTVWIQRLPLYWTKGVKDDPFYSFTHNLQYFYFCVISLQQKNEWPIFFQKFLDEKEISTLWFLYLETLNLLSRLVQMLSRTWSKRYGTLLEYAWKKMKTFFSKRTKYFLIKRTRKSDLKSLISK